MSTDQSDTTTKGKIPVTVFTGYLGAGKTTILLDVIKQFPAEEYKAVWLKNEIGDVKVDSLVAEESSIASREMTDGCLCCVLVGILGNALDELIALNPDRIFVETSGSAYPAPIAWEVRKKSDKLYLDGIVTVIDAVNFPGYVDKSSTAKLQAKYTDLIIMNKTELVSERQLDKVLDDVIELNPDTPRMKSTKGHVPADVMIGLDTKLFETMDKVSHSHGDGRDHAHQTNECDLIHIRCISKTFDRAQFIDFVKALPSSDVYRAKGVVALSDGAYGLLNFVTGRYTFDDLSHYKEDKTALVLMGDLYTIDQEWLQNHLPSLDPEDIEIILRP